MIGLLPILLLLLLRPSCGQTGDGCGLTVLGPESGTVASRNYPGTYPNHTHCEWSITVAEGLTLAFTFGDLNLEYSQHCSSGSLSVSSQAVIYGPYCGTKHIPKALQVNSSDAIVLFSSGTHRSGRGFLLSYASSRHPDLISCLDKGVHYSSPQVSVYCPAGCKDVAGDIWGQASQGYRDTSVICKSAVHAGAISDDLGGQVVFTREKGITLYEATAANGLQSKTGSLSEKRLMFMRDCDEALDVTEFRASSTWREVDPGGQWVIWSAEHANFDLGAPHVWAAEGTSDGEWLEMDLGGRKNITGIMTRGSTDSRHHFYVKSYKILSSKDGKTWKAYKLGDGKNEKVFEGNGDRQQATYNNFIPPIIGRFLRIAPESWNIRIALKVKLFGCLATRAKNTRLTVYNSPREIPSMTNAPAVNSTVPSVAIQPEEAADPLLMLILIVVGLVLIITGLILFGFIYHKKRKTAAGGSGGCFTGYQKPPSSQKCCRPHLHPSDSELMSYSDEGSASGISASHSPGVPHYAEPDVVPVGAKGQKIPSTFKPALDEGYTLPLVVNHYDVPGRKHEYTEPLPPEPEYATPFLDQALSAARRNICIVKVIPPAQGTKVHLPSSGLLSQYDAPAPRGTVEGEEQAPSLMPMAPEGDTSAGAVGVQGLPYRTHTSGRGACRELPPVPWSHSEKRDSLPHVYHEPL